MADDLLLFATVVIAMITAPFILYIVMVYILKLRACLASSKAKSGSPKTPPDSAVYFHTSMASPSILDAIFNAADYNESYSYQNKWISVNGQQPVQIAVPDIGLTPTAAKSVERESITAIPIQRVVTDYVAPMKDKKIHSDSPPDYDSAKLLESQATIQEGLTPTPPPSYKDSFQMENQPNAVPRYK